MSWYTPKSLVCLREGYNLSMFFRDVLAGITVGVIALPLALAFGINSIPDHVAAELQAIHPWLTPPAMGLYTAVVAGFLISALGGSRVQVGGPTGAFIVIVYGVADKHGYDGLALATLMAGVIVFIMGLARFGTMIKFIPYPVVTGFTTGIAVIIGASQVKDFLGLQLLDAAGQSVQLPADFLHKIQVLAQHIATANPWTIGLSLGSLAVILLCRRFIPRIPGAIVAVTLAAVMVAVFKLDQAHAIETIGTRFGSIPRTLPRPHIPHISWDLVRSLIPDATTIAMLCAIESLLSAVVADGMTGFRHKPDCELMAQGVANIGSVFFFGIPATGAIARTVANVKSGGRTPVAGMVHAVTLLLFMIVAAPLAKAVPLASLSAVLAVVAWNMSELDHFRSILKAPKSDVAVLLTTFGLTVFADLTVAVGVGMVLASLLFMKRMAEVSNVSAITKEFQNPDEETEAILGDLKDPDSVGKRHIPHGVEVYEINGPFFFGVADRLKDTLNQFERPPKVFILRMRRVPAIDATGLQALKEFHQKCKRTGTTLLLSGVHAQPLFAFVESGFDRVVGLDNMLGTIDEAITRAQAVVTQGA